jgi:energy-converting hydrogenase B subunit D
MMLAIQIIILIFVAIAGTAVVLTRDVTSQVIGLSFYGCILALMFFIFQAPDVAFSQITIGAVALPLMFMLALARIRRDEEHRRALDAERKKDSASAAA